MNPLGQTLFRTDSLACTSSRDRFCLQATKPAVQETVAAKPVVEETVATKPAVQQTVATNDVIDLDAITLELDNLQRAAQESLVELTVSQTSRDLDTLEKVAQEKLAELGGSEANDELDASGVAKLGHTGARALATGGCAPPVQTLLKIIGAECQSRIGR